jgi:Rv0078B-related antitoxin
MMTPQAALQKQIEKYRAMTGEERLKLGLDLHELSCEIAREGVRHQHPDAGPDEVERLLRKRIALAQQL